MDLTHYRDKLIGNEDERAVSPVIGVILMVAITVILAAVIAAFVLDIGDLDDSAPNAQFEWESDEDESEVVVTMTSGDNIDADRITLVDGDGDEQNWGVNEITSGDEHDFGGYEEGTHQIIWEADGSSTILSEYEV